MNPRKRNGEPGGLEPTCSGALPTNAGFGRRFSREGGIVPFLRYAEPRLKGWGRKLTKKYSNSDLMKIAVEEYLKCTEYPKVGVVVAKDGLILSTGFRGEVAKKHAERVALEKLAMPDRIRSTVFTTLEPCVALQANQATESCAELIIASGVREVLSVCLIPMAPFILKASGSFWRTTSASSSSTGSCGTLSSGDLRVRRDREGDWRRQAPRSRG